MYRNYDAKSAIREVQTYLALAGTPDIVVVPSGIFDENTRLSVKDFQRRESIDSTGVVDLETFDRLYNAYTVLEEKEKINSKTNSFISFPLKPNQSSKGMMHINSMLSRLLDYYGFTHNLRQSNFYSSETENAVAIMRNIYLLEEKNYIDEALYSRMLKDHDSIGEFANNFS